MLYGCFCKKDITVKTLQEKIPEKSSCRIVFVSDLHLSLKSFHEKNVSLLPGMINALQPDWCLLGGDTFDIQAESEGTAFLQQFALWIAQISPRSGFIIVPGDHDSQLGEAGWHLSSTIHLLKDDSMLLSDKIILWGCNYPGYGDKKIQEKLRNVILSAQPDDVILVLAHVPEVFNFLPDDSRILQLSGDTHGGLIHLPCIPDGALASCWGYHTKYVSGWYGCQGGKRLFVSSGFGGQGIRGLRIGIAPQIVLLVFNATDTPH